MVLQPGLNALVGPNGSGKTNFLDFLGFLDTAVHAGATAAISDAGGLARVFSQENTSRKTAHLVTRISGLADISELMNSKPAHPLFHYEYELEIKFSREHSSLFISKELLRLRKLHSSETDARRNTSAGTIQITRRSPLSEEPPKWDIGARTFADNARNPMAAIERVYLGTKVTKLRDRFGVIGFTYKETFHGVQLLKKTRLENAAAASPSAKAFFEQISRKMDCWWFAAKAA